MDKSELLAELDTYFATKGSEVSEGTLGSEINKYHILGALVRANDVAQEIIVNFYVYKEGQGAAERAYYSGDPLNTILRLKILDYINVTSGWVGTIYQTFRPRAICRVIQDPAVGEVWLLITETAPDVYTDEPIVNGIELS